MFRTTIAGVVLLSVAFAVDAKPTLDEMYELIQKQQAEISSLKEGLAENNAKTESTFTSILSLVKVKLVRSKSSKLISNGIIQKDIELKLVCS